MRITWLFGAAAIVTAVFGLGMLLAPEALVAVYGMTLNDDGLIVARLLGGQLLGYTVLEWLALRGERQVREANLRSVVLAEFLGLAVSGLAAVQGIGNSLVWGLVVIFLLFTVWRAYYLWFNRAAIAN